MMMFSEQHPPQEACGVDVKDEQQLMGESWVETTDEDGNVHYFERIDELEVDGKEYVVLIYHGKEGEDQKADDEGHDEDIVLMRLVRHPDGDEFVQIEEDEEFERVLQVIEGLGGSQDLQVDANPPQA